MTTKTDEQERADFESWYMEQYPTAGKPVMLDGEYMFLGDSKLFAGFRAGRRAALQEHPAMPADVIANAMRDVADRYAHRMAMSLECILLDYSGKWYDEAALVLGAYRSAMNAIHENESPTHMGEPVIARRRIEGES